MVVRHRGRKGTGAGGVLEVEIPRAILLGIWEGTLGVEEQISGDNQRVSGWSWSCSRSRSPGGEAGAETAEWELRLSGIVA